VRGDVRDQIVFDVDQIYHLACPASPKAYQADPIGTTMTAVQGTYNALRLANGHDARILIASTSEVYGDPKEMPQSESYVGHVNSIGPRSCYDEGKRAAESLAMDFWRMYRTDVRIARIFNTYGPGMAIDDGRVVSSFVADAIRGEELQVHGNGRQSRTFCYVSDTVEQLVGLMEYEGEDSYMPTNVGGYDDLMVVELAEMIRAKIVDPPDVRFYDRPVDDPRWRRPDLSRICEMIGWPKQGLVRLTDGLDEVIADFRERIEVKQ
jgi:UDP-glucuronate decarboxylase